MTRACTTAALALLFVVLSAPVLAPARAQAGETIRMAIFQSVEPATVASSSGLIVRAPNDTIDSNGPITLAARPSGPRADCQPLPSGRPDAPPTRPAIRCWPIATSRFSPPSPPPRPG